MVYGRQSFNARAISIVGALLLLPISLSIVLSLSKHEGTISTAPAASSIKTSSIKDSPVGVMSDIPKGANTALVKYIDALTTGLHTGSAIDIRNSTIPGCPCRIIGDNFEAIYAKANLIGGAYSLKRSTVLKNSSSEVKLKVTIKMTDTTHVLRKTGAKELWKGTDITAYFTLTPDAKNKNLWKVRNTSVKA